MSLVKICPKCKDARPPEEFVCGNIFSEKNCGYSLYEVFPTLPAPPEEISATPAPAPTPEPGETCANGHPIAAGEFMCGVCGETVAAAGAPRIVIKGWSAADTPIRETEEARTFLATRETQTAELKIYQRGVEPMTVLYPALTAIDTDHCTRLIGHGRDAERAFEIWEHLPLGSLEEVSATAKSDPAFIRESLTELASALAAIQSRHVIHRDLRPANILIRSRAPLDLVLSEFGTAALSELDLQSGALRNHSRYAAPETIVGACSPASDWWSLGVITLEMLTAGRVFEHIADQAFLLHLVTRGLSVPEDLPEEWRELLMGLLTRDHARRWGREQVSRWLGGERGIPHGFFESSTGESGHGMTLRLGEREWSSPEGFALAAAEAECWDEAKAIFLTGRLATWLQERGGEKDADRAATVRSIAADPDVPDDARLALALLALNENLPLCLRGEIVSPAWVGGHPDIAITWLDSTLPKQLRRLQREAWFSLLRERADRIRARLREQKERLDIDPARLTAALLATSRGALEKRWHERRKNFPEADHHLLASAIARRAQTEDDLILLIAAPICAFRPAEEVIEETLREAATAKVKIDRNSLAARLAGSRSATFEALDERLRNFVRCGNETADRWADTFRQERRVSLARALVLLAIPADEWAEPPRQEYVRNILEFFRRRIIGGLQRGALVRMTIAKTSARIDLTELGGLLRPAHELVSIFLGRIEKPLAIDPAVLGGDPDLERRLRRLVHNTDTYQRDTGIDALYLGFPFLVIGAAGSTRPRIAPLLLWPARVNAGTGTRASAQLAFDETRGEIRVNPALESLLGDAAEKWREALDEIRGRDRTDIQAILDTLRPLAEVPGPQLAALPPVTHRAAPGSLSILASAVLFHCDFSGQTIAEDLAQLANRSLEGTALAGLIRAEETAIPEPIETRPPEQDRYFTAASDPSQEAAVFQARVAPGLVVQGPPGTGKSQTIVNIVSDAVGRGERVLIVCQKPAALEVVRKRLDAEGLGRRLLFLKDTTSDRKPTLQAIREQLARPARSAEHDTRLAREREGIATHIEALENSLDAAHHALHRAPVGRPSYRDILDGLIEMESESPPPVTVPRLRVPLGQLDEHELQLLTSRISELAVVWRKARYEESPLTPLAHFETDESVVEDFLESARTLLAAEETRNEMLASGTRFFDFTAAEAVTRWLEKYESEMRRYPPSTFGAITEWKHLLKPEQGLNTNPVARFSDWLGNLDASLESLPIPEEFYNWLATQEDKILRRMTKDAARIAEVPYSFLAKKNPARWLAGRRISSCLNSVLGAPTALFPAEIVETIALEMTTREARAQVDGWQRALGETPSASKKSLPAFRDLVREMRTRLATPLAAAKCLADCPSPEIAEELRDRSKPEVWNRVLDDCHATLKLLHATTHCATSLEDFIIWANADWIAARQTAFATRARTDSSLFEMIAASTTLVPFQDFRTRASDLPPQVLEIFSILRKAGEKWQSIPDSSLGNEIARTLRHEALLRWKAIAEKDTPALLMSRAEAEAKVEELRGKLELMRSANRRLLGECPASATIGAGRAWDEITMFTGPRARRLREVVERGEALGLYHLRPVWLVNPEMVCRVFPLQKDLFDVVIFDEASQLPVEAALPSLFRARRVVVSGDDKQMPPSRFFGATVLDDGDEDDDGNADETEEEAAERISQASGKREVKDCTDLLSLARSVLPSATLEIHYRSRYRHLIEFSNAAFYAGRLHVPARHPDSEILRAMPLEIDRVDTEYLSQTNPGEAARVVDRLADVWKNPPSARPSCGVLTFNLKQAELIQDLIEERAEADEDFRKALGEELSRTDKGEDMRFFVKNLESVQGDERDWIIFSTTFGRDKEGVFRRNFGILGQQGGERRLNVAVTRAREKILIITSIPMDSVSAWLASHGSRPPLIPRDYLQAWLAYAERLHGGDLPAAHKILDALNDSSSLETQFQSAQAASPFFVREVGEFITSLGHKSISSSGDAFGFDHAIIDPRTGLFGIAIECDAPDQAVLATARARELWRPAVVAQSIPSVHRVTSKAWYENRQEETDRLRAAIITALK